jgi:AcrR family transcriptional regulator
MARPRKFDETRVVTAARDRFWVSGYAGTSLDDLCEVTGLGRGSLYGAFGDKHALYLRALDDYCTNAAQSSRERLRGGEGSAYERLAAHVRGAAEDIAGDTGHRGCLMAKGAAELGSAHEDVAKRIGRTFTELHADLAECLEEARRDGELARSSDPAALAGLLLAVLRGMEALGEGSADPELITTAAEQALALLPRS